VQLRGAHPPYPLEGWVALLASRPGQPPSSAAGFWEVVVTPARRAGAPLFFLTRLLLIALVTRINGAGPGLLYRATV